MTATAASQMTPGRRTKTSATFVQMRVTSEGGSAECRGESAECGVRSAESMVGTFGVELSLLASTSFLGASHDPPPFQPFLGQKAQRPARRKSDVVNVSVAS